jgi:ArsR family transcriptional regulator
MKQIETFQMLADQTRLRALFLMQNQDELCVCELVVALDLSQPKISRHLGALRDAGLLISRRDAQWVFYQIAKTMPDWRQQVLAAALHAIKDEAVLRQDARRLAEMKNRPDRSAQVKTGDQNV